MNRFLVCFPAALVAGILAWPSSGRADDPVSVAPKVWTLKAEIVEATSDKDLCPSHDISVTDSAKHRCKFMCAIQILEGSYGKVNLAGVKIVLAGDQGRSLEGMEISSLAVTYDASLTVEQKLAMADIVQRLIPMKWVKRTEGVAVITWKASDDALEVRVADRGQLAFTPSKDEQGKPVLKSGLAWWNASKTDDMRKGLATFGFRGEGMDLNYSNVGAFRTRIEAKGSLERVPQPPPSEPGADVSTEKK
jgi:hypothetical protein